MLRFVLLAFGASVVACGSLPPFPEVWQCAVQGSPRAFYCVNTRTEERKKLPIEHSTMFGAQCLSEKDYASSEAWIAKVEQIAQQRCSK